MTGFKFKRVDFTCGSEEFPAGSDSQSISTRSISIVKAIANSIVNMSTNWVFDESMQCFSVDDIKSILDSNGTMAPALFLENSITQCKLFISYFSEYSIADSSNICVHHALLNSPGEWYGLYMSIIPYSNTESNAFTINENHELIIPSSATRLIGTSMSDNTCGKSAVSSRIYSYGVYSTSSCIAISYATSTNGVPSLKTPTYAIGKIIGNLAHSNDSSSYAQYGVVLFMLEAFETLSQSVLYGTSSCFGNSVVHLGDSSNLFEYMSGSICNISGDWVDYSENNYCVKLYPSDIMQLSNKVNSTSNFKSRWVPYSITVVANDISANGVVPGDGFKGYLDTDLFRCAIGTYLQTYDNGSFICCDSYNNLIGWDSSNTDNL